MNYPMEWVLENPRWVPVLFARTITGDDFQHHVVAFPPHEFDRERP
jgi:hypothetical protein